MSVIRVESHEVGAPGAPSGGLNHASDRGLFQGANLGPTERRLEQERARSEQGTRERAGRKQDAHGAPARQCPASGIGLGPCTLAVVARPAQRKHDSGLGPCLEQAEHPNQQYRGQDEQPVG